MVDLIVDTGADVVSLPETTADFAAELAVELGARGVPMQHFTFTFTQEKSDSTTLLVSTALGEYTADTSTVTTSNRPSLVATPGQWHRARPVRRPHDGPDDA